MAEQPAQRHLERHSSTAASSVPSHSSLPSQTPGVDAFAGAVANALLQSFHSSVQSQGSAMMRSAASDTSFVPGTAIVAASVGVRNASQRTPRRTRDRRESTEEASSFQQAREQASSVSQQPWHTKRPRISFEPPSLFESVRRRRTPQSVSKQSPSCSKSVHYSRDIVLLPPEYRNKSGDVVIPRSGKRSLLGRAGLIGKIEINSTMTDLEVRKEICEVFSMAMGITADDIKHGYIFPFVYLQRAGSGTRALCSPSVKTSFEWNGKQVASLAKAGSFIYVLAESDLPGYEAQVSAELSEQIKQQAGIAVEETDHESENDGYVDEELPDFSTVLQPPVLENEPDIIEISSQESDVTPENPDTREYEDTTNLPQTSTVTVDTGDQPCASSLSPPKFKCSSDELDHLFKIFDGQLSEKQIAALYLITGRSYESTLQCLLEGPSIKSILAIMNNHFEAKPSAKVQVDLSTAWSDMLAHYKSNKIDYDLCIRVSLVDNVTIDTGGVRRQVYTQVYTDFARNKYIPLFDGEEGHLRPAISAIARSSGMLRLLGKMLAHSIFQDGIGFPYLAPVCFWYLIGNEDMAIEHVTLKDLPADAATLITELQQASSNDEIFEILNAESRNNYKDVLQRCGINQTIKMSNKEVILEEILSFEGIARITKMLDQLGDGLKTLGVLRMMKLFPNQFVHLFTHTSVTVEDVLSSLKVPPNLESGDLVTISHLKRFIIESSEEVRRKFLFYITGTVTSSSIEISFSEEDEFGTISVHTCSREILFPRVIFATDDEETYRIFSRSLMAVIESKTYNSA